MISLTTSIDTTESIEIFESSDDNSSNGEDIEQATSNDADNTPSPIIDMETWKRMKRRSIELNSHQSNDCQKPNEISGDCSLTFAEDSSSSDESCEQGLQSRRRKNNKSWIDEIYNNRWIVLLIAVLSIIVVGLLIGMIAVWHNSGSKNSKNFQAPNRAYQVSLVNGGKVVALGPRSDIHFPTVIRIPDWVDINDRADPEAKYYHYYSGHHGFRVYMQWSSSIEGPWHTFDLGGEYNGVNRAGVMDFLADKTRSLYGHLGSVDIIVDDEAKEFIMFYHGQNQKETRTKEGVEVPRYHKSFAATSRNGLNFNDPTTAGGQKGHGPKTETVHGITRDICVMDGNPRVFKHHDDGYYAVDRRGILWKPKNAAQPFAVNASDPFGMIWEQEMKPSDLYFTDTSQYTEEYYSPAATWLGSKEFADHPNNPHPGRRILSQKGGGMRMNQVGISKLPEKDLLEVFFWVRKDGDDPDMYTGIYRIVYDISSSNYEDWTVARSNGGLALFDVVTTPEEINHLVWEANHRDIDPSIYADPIQLGAPYPFIDDDGRKYLFFSYYSGTLGGLNEAEGQITSVELIQS